MNYTNDFELFVFDFKFNKSSSYVPLSRNDFIAILYYINLSDELQLMFFSLLAPPIQITIKLIKLITTASLPVSYKELAEKLTINEILIKLRLSDLYDSGFPIELTEINVRMKTRAEFETK